MENKNRMRNRIVPISILIGLSALACGIDLQKPITKIAVETAQVVDIQAPLPKTEGEPAQLSLQFAFGDLKLSPAESLESTYLVKGTALYNAPKLKPVVETSGNVVILRSGDVAIEGLPVAEDDVTNEWDLKLAKTPLDLAVQAGAYSGDFELGGLALNSLSIQEGGSDLRLRFSSPNSTRMKMFSFDSGGARVAIDGLLNANFEQMTFKAGAGDYALTFDGALQVDCRVSIDAGAGSLAVIVPAGVNARAAVEGGLSTVNAGAGWAKTGSGYTHNGEGSTITLSITMGLGTLSLE